MGAICKINLSYLPIKLHYFFLIGGFGGAMPYMPILAKGLGINATAVGLVFTVIPLCILVSKPIFGYLTDYFRNIKVIVFILTAVTAVAYMFILLIPRVKNSYNGAIGQNVECINNNNFVLYPSKYNKQCLITAANQVTNIELTYKTCGNNSTVRLFATIDKIYFENQIMSSKNSSECILNTGTTNIHFLINSSVDTVCDCIENNTFRIRKTKPNTDGCFCEEDHQSLIYSTYEFWVFSLLVVFASTAAATLFTLSDAACYEVLKNKPQLYGRQRLWGTVGWGIIVLFSGFLNDLATGTNEHTDFSPGFYLMLTLLGIDLLLLFKIKLTKANLSTNISKDIKTIFSSGETIIFAITVLFAGAFSGVIWNYEFWYLQDLGATQTLLGLAYTIQCLATELPMFFFSGWFIKTFGHFNCLVLSLLAFSLRFVLYFILKNPWFVLPIELLHGFTFALFYATLTGYASDNAPPGTEATMMGILGGIYEGLGVATGSLFGGIVYDKFGGRYTFLGSSVISLICVFLPISSRFFIRNYDCETERSDPKSSQKNDSEQISEA